MDNYRFDFSISLIIRSFENITYFNKCLNTTLVQPPNSRICSFVPDSPNTYVLNCKYEDCNDIGETINDFFAKYGISYSIISTIKEKGTCAIRFFIQSDYAQVGFCFSERDMKELAKLGVPVEVSFLSWGCVNEA